jgi:hypothetical protein
MNEEKKEKKKKKIIYIMMMCPRKSSRKNDLKQIEDRFSDYFSEIKEQGFLLRIKNWDGTIGQLIEQKKERLIVQISFTAMKCSVDDLKHYCTDSKYLLLATNMPLFCPEEYRPKAPRAKEHK